MALLWWPAQADDRESILRLIQGPRSKISDLHIVGDWACANSQGLDSGGYFVLFRLDGHWQLVRGAGGAIAPSSLFLLGVPRADLSGLLGRALFPEEIQDIVSQGPYWVAFTRDKSVREDDLRGMSSWELTLMRNEIYAMHGRTFHDPVLRNYFENRSWYRADPGYSDSRLSDRERANSRLILDYQRRQKGND